MSKKKNQSNSDNHQRTIVAQFEDVFGNKIALFAHHGYKWHIYKDIDGRIVIMQMPRNEARQEYKKLESVYKPLNHG